LNVSAIAKRLRVSRTPVKEAVHKLEQEGLVTILPGGGAVVVQLSERDIEIIYTVRSMLEGLAARIAAQNLTGDELSLLGDILDEAELYALKGRLGEVAERNRRFHRLICLGAKSALLSKMIATLTEQLEGLRESSLEVTGRAAKAQEEHRAILRALEARDGEGAERLMREHIYNTGYRSLYVARAELPSWGKDGKEGVEDI
jgi:DNA-binding GntR family transcriptional regulator